MVGFAWPTSCSPRGHLTVDLIRSLVLRLSGGKNIVKTYQIDIVASAVLRDFEQIRPAFEALFSRQIMSDVLQRDRLDGIDQDLTFIHPVTAPPP